MKRNKPIYYDLDNEIKCSKHIPVINLVDPTTAELSDGALFSTIALKGISFQTELNQYLNHFNTIWQQYLTQLNDQFCLYVTMQRKKINHDLSGDFLNTFLNLNSSDMFLDLLFLDFQFIFFHL